MLLLLFFFFFFGGGGVWCGGVRGLRLKGFRL